MTMIQTPQPAMFFASSPKRKPAKAQKLESNPAAPTAPSAEAVAKKAPPTLQEAMEQQGVPKSAYRSWRSRGSGYAQMGHDTIHVALFRDDMVKYRANILAAYGAMGLESVEIERDYGQGKGTGYLDKDSRLVYEFIIDSKGGAC